MIVNWCDGVNTNIQKSGTSWEEIQGFICDNTRSGKQKRRLSASQTKKQYNVSFNFNYREYLLFSDWYQNTLRYGFHSFYFPKIDEINGNEVEYRFADGGNPSYENNSGKIIKASMIWEEV